MKFQVGKSIKPALVIDDDLQAMQAIVIYEKFKAPIAQLDRVLGFEPSGREFESLWARQIINLSSQVLFE